MSSGSQLNQMVKEVQRLIQAETFDDPRYEKVKGALAKSQNPKARKMLVEISVRQANGLARQQRYGEARAALALVEHEPAAVRLLDKIDAADPPETSTSRTRFVLIFAILIVVIGGAVAAVMVLNGGDDGGNGGTGSPEGDILALCEAVSAEAANIFGGPCDEVAAEATTDETFMQCYEVYGLSSASDFARINECSVSLGMGNSSEDMQQQVADVVTDEILNTCTNEYSDDYRDALRLVACVDSLSSGASMEEMRANVAAFYDLDIPDEAAEDPSLDMTRNAIIATNEAVTTQIAETQGAPELPTRVEGSGDGDIAATRDAIIATNDAVTTQMAATQGAPELPTRFATPDDGDIAGTREAIIATNEAMINQLTAEPTPAP